MSAIESSTSRKLVAAARKLSKAVGSLKFSEPVVHVYNPLEYARAPHELYLRKYGAGPKRVVFLGMNPGPFGMAQTGVPFGQIQAVRDWLGISGKVGRPENEHPKRPITGFDCDRSEVSGERLWGFFAKQFREPEKFFVQHIVLNYCPLVFIESTGRNRTPDKLPAKEKAALFAACDQHLAEVVNALEPDWLIGVGQFAFDRAAQVFVSGSPRKGKILHPSPASPAANRAWAEQVSKQLLALGVWR